jgi:serine phosphatase RsbU (regulator of sigma subunit)/anti-sigma regulatory factor (Ser/Thr protein kinase)
MPTFFQKIASRWQSSPGKDKPAARDAFNETTTPPQIQNLEISIDDPLWQYLLHQASPVEINKLNLVSPILDQLRREGYRIIVPLISQGELIGLLNLGVRMSEQEYSTDDHHLLSSLATQAAPSLQVAQLAHQQQLQARERERLEHELRVARIIQQTLLPKELPHLPGWQVNTFWQPAREVGGDFYDFIPLPGNKIGVVIADVTDKGVPAALVMATTRTLLRAAVENFSSPGKVLQRVNDLLHPDIPAKMFVTCLYGVLDPQNGKFIFANAGHNLPYHHSGEDVLEHRARGMPLGLLPGMIYEEKEIYLSPGDLLLLSSDGLVEAHNSQGKMFGFGKMKEIMRGKLSDQPLISALIAEYETFTGNDHEQEDDITLVTLEYMPNAPDLQSNVWWETLASFELPSEPGNERTAALRVLEVVESLNLTEQRRKHLETAVSEAALNAIEHGNNYQRDTPVKIEIKRSTTDLLIRIQDFGGGTTIPEPVEPDLDAKLAGLQSPRGWGLFLIRNMVDEMKVYSDTIHHTVELLLHLNK